MAPKTKKSKRLRSCTLSALVASGALATGCAHAPMESALAPPPEYRIGRDDLVEVQVWKEPALSAVAPVRPDGKISLPMAGELAAEGKSTTELRQEVESRLGAFVPSPSVTVLIREVRSARIFVLGEVAHPGMFPLTGTVTVLQAVALAGGATEFAHKSRIVILRRRAGSDRPERLLVSLDEIVRGRSLPVPLWAGDTVYVP